MDKVVDFGLEALAIWEGSHQNWMEDVLVNQFASQAKNTVSAFSANLTKNLPEFELSDTARTQAIDEFSTEYASLASSFGSGFAPIVMGRSKAFGQPFSAYVDAWAASCGKSAKARVNRFFPGLEQDVVASEFRDCSYKAAIMFANDLHDLGPNSTLPDDHEYVGADSPNRAARPEKLWWEVRDPDDPGDWDKVIYMQQNPTSCE